MTPGEGRTRSFVREVLGPCFGEKLRLGVQRVGLPGGFVELRDFRCAQGDGTGWLPYDGGLKCPDDSGHARGENAQTENKAVVGSAEVHPEGAVDLHVHILVANGGPGFHPTDYCARFEIWRGVNPAVDNQVVVYAGDLPHETVARAMNADRELEFLMFVLIGQFSEETEGVEPKGLPGRWMLVRLQPLDECSMFWMHPAQGVSRALGEGVMVVIGKQDREAIPPWSPAWFFPVEDDELPDEIVEGCPQLMDDVAGGDPEPERRKLRLQAKNVDVGFRVVLSHRHIYVVLPDPDSGFLVEGVQCLLAPSDAGSAHREVSQ